MENLDPVIFCQKCGSAIDNRDGQVKTVLDKFCSDECITGYVDYLENEFLIYCMSMPAVYRRCKRHNQTGIMDIKISEDKMLGPGPACFQCLEEWCKNYIEKIHFLLHHRDRGLYD